ncbi:VOC family protein [Longimicrobium sp.]|uniref:VOC family protein n=1 Tax=Longimicrobium sp. TaxID=2029185 RepID=UPI002B52BE46|nr:VOC family protein [Longimicrobium sp.]HSU17270.1 VOC family protein [Longimicrobium sp.]
MNPAIMGDANVQQAVPFFDVTDMDASLRFYAAGLGFEVTRRWIDEGRLRWCWLQLGGAALMLQERRPGSPAGRTSAGKAGEGVSVYFICSDALAIHRELTARGIAAARKPFVGNGMWVVPIEDPDGFRIFFESPTDAPEETEL